MKYALLALSLLTLGIQCESTKKPKASPQPNILLIVADDLGYSDIAPFGGNIATPTLSSLADESIKFSRFYANPTCSPTRSSLLTGNDNHVAGLGIMSEMDYPALHAQNLPGYSGQLSKEVVTIPEVLKTSGYHTYMVGKWHLGEGKGANPHDRGFEETFILGTGGGSHYNDKKPLSPLQNMEYTRNGEVVEPHKDFYSTRDYTDSLLGFIERNKADQKPFFGFLSYTAVHDPLHTPKEYADKYKGKFSMGYDSLWALRLSNLKALGLLPKDINKFSKNPAIPAWNKLSKEQQAHLEREMEVYAGMLEYMDMSIGRVINYLKENGLYENTLIVFMSDNGANGAIASTYPGNEDGKYMASFNNSPENLGLPNSFPEAGPAWAQASSSPFRFFKSFATEGGIRVPAMIKAPGKSTATWNHHFTHVTDIMPTFLALAGASYPESFNGNKIHACIGKSLLPVIQGKEEQVHKNQGYGWELFEMKAYIKDNWKLLRLPFPLGTGNWQLYNLDTDPCETTDLSDQYPDLKKELLAGWEQYAKENGVYNHNGHYDTLYRISFAKK